MPILASRTCSSTLPAYKGEERLRRLSAKTQKIACCEGEAGEEIDKCVGYLLACEDTARPPLTGELTRDETESKVGQGFDRRSFEQLVARREELFGGTPLAGDSVDLIREAREIRDAEVEAWA